jgi:hypothetical protein
VSSAVLLADMGNVGLAVCAALDTTSVIAYWARAHDDQHGRWWKSPFGVHLMCFMLAFAIVLDQSVIALLTGPGLLVAHSPLARPDWFAWERVISFAVLIPAVLAWRLVIILRPPGRD